MESTPGPAARMTISPGLRPWGPSTHSSAAWDSKDTYTQTLPRCRIRLLKGAERERQEAKVHPPIPQFPDRQQLS